jgi:AbrB family looped-hinge helix DNA binding protein
MNLGVISKTNSKGQIVLPKKFRDELGISDTVYLNLAIRGSGIYIHPIKRIVSEEEENKSFLDILNITRGSWAGDSWPETEKRRRKIELAASRKRKKAW